MKKLMKDINKFYKHYDLTNIGLDMRVTKADMYDYNALMSVYEAIWMTMEYYEDKTACEFMASLYQDVSDRMFAIENDLVARPNHNKALAIFMYCVSVFGTMSIGAFIAVWIECGFDILIVVGIMLAGFVAISSGIGAKETMQND